LWSTQLASARNVSGACRTTSPRCGEHLGKDWCKRSTTPTTPGCAHLSLLHPRAGISALRGVRLRLYYNRWRQPNNSQPRSQADRRGAPSTAARALRRTRRSSPRQPLPDTLRIGRFFTLRVYWPTARGQELPVDDAVLANSRVPKQPEHRLDDADLNGSWIG